MKLFMKIRNLIFKDVSAENELKELSVLLRILCIIDVFFNLTLILFFNYSFHSKIYQWGIAFLLFNCLILWMTYWDKTSASVYVYSVVMIFTIVTYSIALGSTVGFQFSLYTLIFLYYYKTDDSLLIKNTSAILVALSIIATWFVLEVTGDIVEFTRSQELTLLLANNIFISIRLITVAYFYYLKFASNEHKILKYAKKLEKLATVDALTQLQNRRGMLKYLEKLTNNASSLDQLSLALSDIDFFKKINDTYGHDTGDYVLTELGKIFTAFMKDKGMIARWGGEEFLFAFEHKNGDYAFEQLNKLKYVIEKKLFVYKEHSFHITMTFGLEEYDASVGITETIERADEKLYQGKESGRNRVIY